LLESRLDEIEHGRPLREEHDLSVRLCRHTIEQLVESFELRGPARLLLVDEEGTVGGHPAHQECGTQAEQIHLREEGLSYDLRDCPHVRVMDLLLLGRRRDAYDLDRAWRELEADGLARTAKQDGPEPFAKVV